MDDAWLQYVAARDVDDTWATHGSNTWFWAAGCGRHHSSVERRAPSLGDARAMSGPSPPPSADDTDPVATACAIAIPTVFVIVVLVITWRNGTLERIFFGARDDGKTPVSGERDDATTLESVRRELEALKRRQAETQRTAGWRGNALMSRIASLAPRGGGPSRDEENAVDVEAMRREIEILRREKAEAEARASSAHARDTGRPTRGRASPASAGATGASHYYPSV